MYDLVDFVTEESRRAGRVRKYVQRNWLKMEISLKKNTKRNIHIIPQTVRIDKLTRARFILRVRNNMTGQNCY